GLLALGLVVASLAGDSLPGVGALVRRVGLAVSLLLQFRIWDDLTDRERDRQRHPERILACARALGPVQRLGGAAAAASVALLATGPEPVWRLAVYAVLVLGLHGWYTVSRRVWTAPLLHYHLILAKYPVFVWLLGGDTTRPLPRLLAALAVYFALCAYEVLHDPDTAAIPGARWALHAELVALVAISIGLTPSLVWEVPA